MLVGADTGPTPIEFLLVALASCLTAGIANISATRGVKLTAVQSTVEGDIDLRAIFGLTDEVRNGYQRLRAHFAITGEAPAETLQAIVERSRARSAVFDVLTNGVPVDMIDLRAEGIRSVVWATGYRRAYPWLDVPVLDAAGEIRHEGGVTPVPGLYVLGLQFQRRRNSAFIDGVGEDAACLADHVAGVLGVHARRGAALANWTPAYSHQ